MDPSYLVGRVRESNAQARNAWERWATHRAQVMALLRELPISGARIALLGAGHLHDVQLDELLSECDHVDLVDLDADAVSSAVQRQPGASARCTVHAPVDLTGVLDVLAEASSRQGGVNRVFARLADARCELPAAPFDITVSLGVLTQLMQAVGDAGVDSMCVPGLSLAVRDKHLRDLVHLTRPGGTFVLVTDFVSTTSAPALVSMAASQLESQLASLIAAGNFFTGTNPYRMIALLEETEPFKREIEHARFAGPWLWAITASRQHLTGAILAQRRIH